MPACKSLHENQQWTISRYQYNNNIVQRVNTRDDKIYAEEHDSDHETTE